MGIIFFSPGQLQHSGVLKQQLTPGLYIIRMAFAELSILVLEILHIAYNPRGLNLVT